jgi:hypothetical protein
MEHDQLAEVKCYCCMQKCTDTDKFCGTCGYPLQGTPEEQKQFSINYTVNQFEKDIVRDRVNEARIVLYVIAAFTLIAGLVNYFNEESVLLLIINLIITGIFVGLAIWSNHKAFAAIFTGAMIYLSLILLNAFIDPATIFKGIIFKVIFIVAFIKAAYGAYKFKVSS